MIWTDAGESDKCPQRVAVPWMCHLPYLNSFPWSPPMSWLLHLAAGLLCLASLHITQATVVSNRHAHLDCNGYFYTHTHTHTLTHAHTSKGLTSPAKHSTPTSEYFERGATQPPRVLGSLYGHHRDPLRHPDHVWSPPCRPAVKCPSANQRGGGSCERGTGRIGYFSGCYDDDKSGAI